MAKKNKGKKPSVAANIAADVTKSKVTEILTNAMNTGSEKKLIESSVKQAKKDIEKLKPSYKGDKTKVIEDASEELAKIGEESVPANKPYLLPTNTLKSFLTYQLVLDHAEDGSDEESLVSKVVNTTGADSSNNGVLGGIKDAAGNIFESFLGGTTANLLTGAGLKTLLAKAGSIIGTVASNVVAPALVLAGVAYLGYQLYDTIQGYKRDEKEHLDRALALFTTPPTAEGIMSDQDTMNTETGVAIASSDSSEWRKHFSAVLTDDVRGNLKNDIDLYRLGFTASSYQFAYDTISSHMSASNVTIGDYAKTSSADIESAISTILKSKDPISDIADAYRILYEYKMRYSHIAGGTNTDLQSGVATVLDEFTSILGSAEGRFNSKDGKKSLSNLTNFFDDLYKYAGQSGGFNLDTVIINKFFTLKSINELLSDIGSDISTTQAKSLYNTNDNGLSKKKYYVFKEGLDDIYQTMYNKVAATKIGSVNTPILELMNYQNAVNKGWIDRNGQYFRTVEGGEYNTVYDYMAENVSSLFASDILENSGYGKYLLDSAGVNKNRLLDALSDTNTFDDEYAKELLELAKNYNPNNQEHQDKLMESLRKILGDDVDKLDVTQLDQHAKAIGTLVELANRSHAEKVAMLALGVNQDEYIDFATNNEGKSLLDAVIGYDSDNNAITINGIAKELGLDTNNDEQLLELITELRQNGLTLDENSSNMLTYTGNNLTKILSAVVESLGQLAIVTQEGFENQIPSSSIDQTTGSEMNNSY